MRRLAIIGTLLGALAVSTAAPAKAQVVVRPVGPVRAAVRTAALLPWRYFYGPRFYYGPGYYYGPSWGPGYYYWW